MSESAKEFTSGSTKRERCEGGSLEEAAFEEALLSLLTREPGSRGCGVFTRLLPS